MGVQHRLDEAIQDFYGGPFDEDARTGSSVDGQVELERTRRIVTGLLAPGSRVLDVGGATGVHSRWLAGAGHEVTLVDPVPSQVARAAQAGTFTALVGDARALPAADGSVDAVLLLGPLYHLVTVVDRATALAEARRVLRPGGTLFAQGIGRLAAFTEAVTTRGFPDLGRADLEILRTGVWFSTHGGFPGGHLHSVAQLRQEVRTAGFTDVVVHGVEGPGVGALGLAAGDERLVALAVELVERLEEGLAGRPGSLDALAERSPHLLAVGRRPR
ncbi:class I SAM-dependent methyltransferase [Ornithinimicrobium sp. W1665]|uniref:class I SAM-dependent methyltransferase n=1 Tax=Ornithinimicrobium sp. W1665 TaxID=3416666 RepID=UPI003CEB3632